MARIFQMSEAASIALHAMVIIAKTKGSVSVDTISEMTGTSRHHVAKVMQRLLKSGYLGSTRGPSGGFYLIIDTEKITLLDIFEAIEGKIVTKGCPMDKQICPFDLCLMNNITNKLSNEFREFLSSKRLEDYLKG